MGGRFTSQTLLWVIIQRCSWYYIVTTAIVCEEGWEVQLIGFKKHFVSSSSFGYFSSSSGYSNYISIAPSRHDTVNSPVARQTAECGMDDSRTMHSCTGQSLQKSHHHHAQHSKYACRNAPLYMHGTKLCSKCLQKLHCQGEVQVLSLQLVTQSHGTDAARLQRLEKLGICLAFALEGLLS